MSSPKPATLTVSMYDIVRMSNADLAVFMEKNRCPDGDFQLPVNGWDKLSKDERNSFADRLKAQQRSLAQNPTTHSRPLNLDHLDVRLRDISSGGNNIQPQALPPIVERSRSPTLGVEDVEAGHRKDETFAYNDLVEDGGHPLYPIDLLDEVSRNPDKYSELLRPWRDPFRSRRESWYNSDVWYAHDGADAPWEVFQKQLARWHDFRKWQRDARWLDDDDGGFPAYVEREKAFAKCFPKKTAAEKLAKIEADPSCLKKGWETKQDKRQDQRNYCQEYSATGPGFPEYVHAAKLRLARHGFTQPFQFIEKLEQQDKLTTWIEYLYFECWWLDRYTGIIERLKPGYDRAWQKLVDSGVLLPHETEEFVKTDECAMRREVDKIQAWEAVQRARARAKQAATHELVTAEERLESIHKRNDLIREFNLSLSGLKFAKIDAARHQILIAWIKDQVPVIKAELDQTDAVVLESAKVKKRRLDPHPDTLRQRGPKKRKLGGSTDNGTAVLTNESKRHMRVSLAVDGERPPPHNDPRSAPAGEFTATQSSRTLDACKVALRGLRRSARIAARSVMRGTASEHVCRRELRPRQRGRTAQ